VVRDLSAIALRLRPAAGQPLKRKGWPQSQAYSVSPSPTVTWWTAWPNVRHQSLSFLGSGSASWCSSRSAASSSGCPQWTHAYSLWPAPVDAQVGVMAQQAAQNVAGVRGAPVLEEEPLVASLAARAVVGHQTVVELVAECATHLGVGGLQDATEGRRPTRSGPRVLHRSCNASPSSMRSVNSGRQEPLRQGRRRGSLIPLNRGTLGLSTTLSLDPVCAESVRTYT
jgi:hypothetical protein